MVADTLAVQGAKTRHQRPWNWPGARPTNDISIEFEIRPKYAVLWFKMYSADHNGILHTSRQCNCRDVCKISLWSAEYVMNKTITKFHWISNSIETSLVGRAPGHPGIIRFQNQKGQYIHAGKSMAIPVKTTFTNTFDSRIVSFKFHWNVANFH